MDSLTRLTETDKEMLRNSWKIVSRDTETIATEIFQMIFEQAPDAKLMFTFMMKYPKEDEKKSKEFTFHAMRFIQIIESTVKHLDNPSLLDPLFLNLGKMHAKTEEQLGFRSHYWSVFKECTLCHFRRAMKADKKSGKRSMSGPEIDSAIILWREVLRFIIERMNVGLTANGLIRKANRDLLNERHEEMNMGNASTERQANHNITQISHALRKTELSVIVPEFFMRRKSESSSTGDETN